MLLTYRNALLAAILAAVLLTVAGCGNNPVATVDGVKITETELNERLVQTYGEQVLRSMIDRELLKEAAAERGIEVTEEDMTEAIEEQKAQYETEERFQQFLAANNLSEEEWKDEVRVMVMARKLALHGVDPSEEELQQFFQENQERFNQPATVAMSEIVVSSQEEAQEVIQDLASTDASFADLASRYSLAGSRQAGGERPPVPINQINQPEIREVAQNLPVGEVSEPIEVGGSWLLLKVRDRTEAREASFETDRERIEEQYRMANANSLEDILKQQMEQTNINIVDPRFQGLNEVYSTMPDEIPQFGAEGAEGGAMPMDGHEGHDHGPMPEAPAAPDSQ
jgi:foldase protein PrsA